MEAPTRNFLLFGLLLTATSLLPGQVHAQNAGPDFSIAANPMCLDVVGPLTSTITLTSVGGFSGTVNLVVGAIPTLGGDARLSPSSVFLSPDSSATSTLSLFAAFQLYHLTLTGTSGALSHSTTVTVTAGNFAVSASPASIIMQTGTTANSTISVVAFGGFCPSSSGMTLSTIVSPPKLRTTINPSSIPLSTLDEGATSILTINPSPPGTYTVVIQANIGPIIRLAMPMVNVLPRDSGLTVDGVGACAAQFCSYESQVLTTSRTNDVIMLTAETSGTSSSLSITDSSGLVFTKRVSHILDFFEYYAMAASPLNADNITVDGADYFQVFAVHGAGETIFDPNPSIPAAVDCSTNSCGDCTVNQGVCSASIKTSGLDLVVATTAINDAGPCVANDFSPFVPGFANISVNGKFEVDYSITGVPRTTVTFNCGGTDVSAILMDAIEA